MVKETQKAKIERLERENEDLQRRLNEQIEAGAFMVNEIAELREAKDDDYRKSSAYVFANRELELAQESVRILEQNRENMSNEIEADNKIIAEREKKIEELENEVHKLKCENDQLKLNGGAAAKNVRGAGRKPKFTEQEKEVMRMYRMQGKTVRELATMYECSIGVVHKIINEN